MATKLPEIGELPAALERAADLIFEWAMLLFLLAQVTPDPLAPLPPPTNRGMVSLFSNDDYPKEAMRHRWQGTVQVDLEVSPEGRVSGCRVVRSSGHAVLDKATCDIMRVRAKFIPAKDRNGDPTVDVYRSPPIQWRIAR